MYGEALDQEAFGYIDSNNDGQISGYETAEAFEFFEDYYGWGSYFHENVKLIDLIE